MIDLYTTRSVEDAAWSRLARVTALLTLIGAACGWSVPLRNLVDARFLIENGLAGDQRRALIVCTLLGGALGALVSLVGVAWKRGSALPTLERLAIGLGPFTVLTFLPVLLVPSVWYRTPTTFLVILSGLVILLERTLVAFGREFGPSLAELCAGPSHWLPLWVRRALPLTLVVLGAAAYSAYSLYYSIQQHHRLQTAAYDLGIFDNLMYSAMNGRPFRSTVLLGTTGATYLACHAEFAMLLFVPLYWLWPDAEMLLTLQAVFLGAAAIPLYLFARTQLPRGTAVLLAFTYLVYAPMHGASFYDFHWLPTSILFQFFLYFAIARNKKWLIFACYVMLTLIREDIPVGLAVLGIFLVVSGIRPKLGLVFAVCSAVSFVAIKFGIMLWAGPFFFADLYYRQLVAPGEEGFGSVTRTLLTNPAYVLSTVLEAPKLNYFLHLMAPLAFLPLRRLLLILLICSSVLFTFLTTAYDPTVSIRFQYSAHWIPYLFAATILMLGVLSRGAEGALRRRAALGAMVFGVVVHSYVFGAIFQHETFVGGFLSVPFRATAEERQAYTALQQIKRHIPRQASVAATDLEVAHISNRADAFTLRSYHGDADYLLLNSAGIDGQVRHVTNQALSRNDYGLVEHLRTFYLFEKGREAPGTDEALSRLGLRSGDDRKHAKERRLRR